ncbi:hypothetical protein [Prauserella endophytica]|uniref:Uncharacterized protein n=1 Tax=Prauserella endophytica TaxID=1592324 RepID=A0ABY2S3C6_9PSEU|nr:hypothetical protein [Prauserella endophytica]TKG69908.1 hypothetical protein FCN18_17420 [Prauserella endophytica]
MTDDTVTENPPAQEQPAEPVEDTPTQTPQPAPPTGWDPYAPPPAAPAPMGWDPYSPPRPAPAPMGWDPYSPPPAPTGWDPYTPPPAPVPMGWDPYTPPVDGSGQQRPAPVQNGQNPPTGWVTGRAVLNLWSASGSPGVWIAVQGVGWKRLSPASESGHSHLTLLALLAKNYRLPVSYHEDARGEIDQLVV